MNGYLLKLEGSQNVVSKSSTEAEYCAMGTVVLELVSLLGLLKNIDD